MNKEEVVSGLGKNITIPDHTEHLKNAAEKIEKIKQQLNNTIADKCIDGNCHTAMYDSIAIVLYYIGQLSQQVFNFEEELEEEYKMAYLKYPELGKKLFWQHYEKLHRPYTLLKNRCYRMFTELDDEYINVHKGECPPNWKE